MAKKRSPATSKGKPSESFKQKKSNKGGKANPQNFRRKKAREKEHEEFDEVRLKVIVDSCFVRIARASS